MLTARSEESLKAVADAINAKSGGRAHILAADLADDGYAEKIVKAAEEKLGQIDILVNNSGGPPPRVAENISMQDWSTQFDTMVLPLFEITRLVLPGMKACVNGAASSPLSRAALFSRSAASRFRTRCAHPLSAG